MPKFKQIGIDIDVHRALEAQRQSFGETENDILRRMLLPVQKGEPRTANSVLRKMVERRSRGSWRIHYRGTADEAQNMKEAYREALLLLDRDYPSFLRDFSQLSSRSRRFVSRKPEELYSNAKHLAKDHAHRLKDGWFFDTNLSREQVEVRLRAASDLVGLSYGVDLDVSEAN